MDRGRVGAWAIALQACAWADGTGGTPVERDFSVDDGWSLLFVDHEIDDGELRYTAGDPEAGGCELLYELTLVATPPALTCGFCHRLTAGLVGPDAEVRGEACPTAPDLDGRVLVAALDDSGRPWVDLHGDGELVRLGEVEETEAWFEVHLPPDALP